MNLSALLGAIRIPVPNPGREPHRCNLEPLKPETPKTTLYLVLTQGRLTLQVVCLGLAHFQLPVRPPKSPSPPTGENPGRPWGGAGRGIVPEGQVAKGFLHYSRVVTGGHDAHGVLAHGAAQRVHMPDPRNQVAGGGRCMRKGAGCTTQKK